MRTSAIWITLFALAGVPAQADTVVTRDGREIKCDAARVTSSGSIEVTKAGGTFELPANSVLEIIQSAKPKKAKVPPKLEPEAEAEAEEAEEQRLQDRQERTDRAQEKLAKKVRAKVTNARKWCDHWSDATREFESDRLMAEAKLPPAEKEVEDKRRRYESLRHTCSKRCSRSCTALRRAQAAAKEQTKAEVVAAKLRASIRKAEKGIRKTDYSLQKANQRLERAVAEAEQCGVDVSDLLPSLDESTSLGLFEVGDLKGLQLEQPELVPNGSRMKLTAILRNETSTEFRTISLAVEFYGPDDALLGTGHLQYSGLRSGEWAADDTQGPRVDQAITRVRVRLASAW